jgi:hypothetical protein
MRKKPYTKAGIKRLKCFRCGKKASQQWQICSDDNQYRPICWDCDMKLNEMVLKFMGFEDYRDKLFNYSLDRFKD